MVNQTLSLLAMCACEKVITYSKQEMCSVIVMFLNICAGVYISRNYYTEYYQIINLHLLKLRSYFRNGAERSGLFCVALYVAQQIKTQDKVDIFSAVKHVRLYRPQCITDMVWFSVWMVFEKRKVSIA